MVLSLKNNLKFLFESMEKLISKYPFVFLFLNTAKITHFLFHFDVIFLRFHKDPKHISVQFSINYKSSQFISSLNLALSLCLVTISSGTPVIASGFGKCDYMQIELALESLALLIQLLDSLFRFLGYRINFLKVFKDFFGSSKNH